MSVYDFPSLSPYVNLNFRTRVPVCYLALNVTSSYISNKHTGRMNRGNQNVGP